MMTRVPPSAMRPTLRVGTCTDPINGQILQALLVPTIETKFDLTKATQGGRTPKQVTPRLQRYLGTEGRVF